MPDLNVQMNRITATPALLLKHKKCRRKCNYRPVRGDVPKKGLCLEETG